MKLNPSEILLPVFFLFGFSLVISAQNNTYILNGNATRDKCNCYTLTKESEFVSGSVWNASKIDLTKSFDFVFNVNLGCRNEYGADGIVFMLQPVSTSIGIDGEGMGFEGISPSIGISLDTYQNSNRNDPDYDHISIQANGIVTHGNDLAGPVQASATSDNIEDCNWHLFRIVWDASTNKIAAYFDKVLRVEADVDLVKSIFNNDPMVYWGFSAATGASYNIQQFCTALNPDCKTDLTNNTACYGKPVSFINQSESFAPIKNYFWDFGDGTISTVENPSAHSYAQPGLFNVKLAITALDGCSSDTLKKEIIIADIPVPLFDITDTCAKQPPRISDKSSVKTGTINKWEWTLDGKAISNSQLPQINGLSAGDHQIQLSVASNVGCASGLINRKFNIRPLPVVDISAQDNCISKPVFLKGSQTDNLTNITSWRWLIDNAQIASLQTISHIFSTPGTKNVQLVVAADNGCISDPVRKSILINEAKVFAGNDSIVIENNPFQLKGQVTQSGNKPLNIKWAPGTGLEDNASLITKGTTPGDQVYTLSVTTAEGCTAEDAVKIIIFKGSAVYVPTAFTPNHDGKNEVLKPDLIAIKQLYYFSIYNRWGQLIFTTAKSGDGWDGTIRGKEQPIGTYVWLLKAIDVVGNVYEKKGTATLMR